MKCRTRVPDSHPPHGAVANLRQTWVGVRSQTGGTLTIPLVGVDAHRALRVEVWRRAHVPDAPPVGQALHAVQARQHHRGGDAGEARALGPGMFSATTAWWGGADLGKHSPADTFGSTNDNEKIRSHTPRQIPQWLATGFWPPMNSMLLLETKKNKAKCCWQHTINSQFSFLARMWKKKSPPESTATRSRSASSRTPPT